MLDRLRAARKLPEQADFRAWKADILAGYHSVESNETWWHLPDRRTLRVVINPNPRGGVTYLFDDVSERVQLESQVNALTRVQSETLDTLKEGVAVFGSDGRLKLHNRAFSEMWELPHDLTAQHPHIDAVIRACRLLAPQDEPWVDLRGAVAGLADLRMGMDCRVDRRDGSVLECAAQPLPDGATLLTFIDVTASVNVARALDRAQRGAGTRLAAARRVRPPRVLRAALAAHQRHRLCAIARGRDGRHAQSAPARLCRTISCDRPARCWRSSTTFSISPRSIPARSS